MKAIAAVVVLLLASLVFATSANALSPPQKFALITATKMHPAKYIYIVSGDEYIISLSGINVAGRSTTADLQFERYDSKGNLLKTAQHNLTLGQGYRMCAQVNNKGQNVCPAFRFQKIQLARCLPRTNICSEEAVMLSVT